MFRTVAEARIRILGPDHPDTLGTLVNHAIASHQQGKTEEAEACSGPSPKPTRASSARTTPTR
ncbi:MAG: tetratricopeptide repeat protein [Sandaracinaceae bacterium]|nr:tetratricopeptide repeat protein [Sandaracinaceae bacterium]